MKTSDRIESAERLDRRAARIAGGRADDGHPLAPPPQCFLEQLADQLHREVLEGQCRAVEQLKQEMVRRQLHQGRARAVSEAAYAAAIRSGEGGVAKSISHEGPHHAERHFLITQPLQRANLVRRHLRHGLGHVEAAIAGETDSIASSKDSTGACPRVEM